MHSEVVVLGGGPGGYAAAFLAADLGMQTTIVEQEPRLGGVCLLRGCIPSKALLHVAKMIDEARELADWGVEYQEPRISIDKLRARKEKVISTLSGGLSQLAKRRKVRVIHARATFFDSNTLQLEGGDPSTYENASLTYDKLVLAAGSSPAMPGFFKTESDRVMDSTGALELPDIPEKLLVVGGGYIGLEMGTVYAELGSQVSVVELTDGLLLGADRDLVKPLQKRLESLFKNIWLGTKVTGLEDQGDKIEVQFEGPHKNGSEAFDRVLVCVGRRPNSQGLGLENTQVEIDDKGFVKVDQRRMTADPSIFAIGDIAGEPMLAHKAAHEGRLAIEVIHGESVIWDKQAIPAVVFTDPEIAWAGLTQQEAEQQQREVEIATYPWQASGRAQALGRTEGLTKLIIEPETNRLLGCGIVGVGAGDLISEAVLAIEMGCDATDLAETIHPHPTLSETVAFAGEVQLGTATEIYKPKRRK
ncbi:MAG: dihydrolipoyl dehydrogenase [Pirellulales bacterium]